MIHRRSLLRGLFVAPAIVAFDSLMPIKGIPLIIPFTAADIPEIALPERQYYMGMYGNWYYTEAGDTWEMIKRFPEQPPIKEGPIYNGRYIFLQE